MRLISCRMLCSDFVTPLSGNFILPFISRTIYMVTGGFWTTNKAFIHSKLDYLISALFSKSRVDFPIKCSGRGSPNHELNTCPSSTDAMDSLYSAAWQSDSTGEVNLDTNHSHTAVNIKKFLLNVQDECGIGPHDTVWTPWILCYIIESR